MSPRKPKRSPAFHPVLSSTLHNIQSGVPGLAQKIEQIRAMAAAAIRDANFRQRVVELLRGIPERDWDGEIAAVVRHVQRIRYTRDPATEGGLEVFIDPRLLLEQIEQGQAYGDCDDHVLLATAMLEVIGHRVRFKVGGTARGAYQHIWIEVAHPDRGWVPVELIRDEIPIGYDPGQLFNHTETHRGALMGFRMQVEPVAGGGVSRVRALVDAQPVHHGLLPSDMLRATAYRDQIAGGIPLGAFREVNRGRDQGDGLGWVAAVAALVTAAAGAWQAYDERKDAKRRQRDAYQRGDMAAANQPVPRANYTPFIQQAVIGTTTLVDEFTGQPIDQVQVVPADFVGPLAPGQVRAGTPEALAAQQPVDYDQRVIDALRAAGLVQTGSGGFGRQGQVVLGTPSVYGYNDASIRQLLEFAQVEQIKKRLAPLVQRYSGYLQYLSPDERRALQTRLDNPLAKQNELTLYGLAGLGEDPPPDPGPYVPKTSQFALPPGFAAFSESQPKDAGGRDVTIREFLKRLEKEAASQEVGTGWRTVLLSDVFDIQKYPAMSGTKGGLPGWIHNWGSAEALQKPAVEFWVYLQILLRDQRYVREVAANWLTQLKWIDDNIVGGIAAAWMASEAARKIEWETKRAAYEAWQQAEALKKKAEAEAKRQAELTEQQKIEAQKREAEAKAEAERLRLEQLAREQAQQAKEAQARAEAELERQRRLAQQRGVIPPVIPGPTSPPGSTVPPGPPAPARSSGGLLLVAGGLALFAMSKKKKKKRA